MEGGVAVICVIATIEVVEGRRHEFLDEFRKIVPKVLAEAGCLEYAPMVDVPTGIGLQSPTRPDVVTVLEKWETIEALEAHLIAPHMIEYRKAVKDVVKGATLRILRPS
jgi:quinol monooxygenase YgiN